MAQGAAALAHAFMGERQVVVSVGVLRYELNGALVGGDRFGQALQLVQHIAQVEKSQRVVGVDLRGGAIALLGFVIAMLVVEQRPQVHAGRRVPGPKREHLPIQVACGGDGRGAVLQQHSLLKQVLRAGEVVRIRLRCRAGADRGHAHRLGCGTLGCRGGLEIKAKLLSERVEQGAGVAHH